MSEHIPPDLRSVDLPIAHRDAVFVVVDKPSGLLAIPGRGPAAQDCVIARVARAIPAASGPLMVHRLDMDTSGLMVVALTAEAQRALSSQFESRAVEKRYVALVNGALPGSGVVRLPTRLDPEHRPLQIYDPVHGRLGETRWEAVEHRDGVTRVRFVPLTGRTHQIRIHAAHPLGLGHPILGDRLYGDPRSAPRLMLHAERLAFVHPETGVWIVFESVAPF